MAFINTAVLLANAGILRLMCETVKSDNIEHGVAVMEGVAQKLELWAQTDNQPDEPELNTLFYNALTSLTSGSVDESDDTEDTDDDDADVETKSENTDKEEKPAEWVEPPAIEDINKMTKAEVVAAGLERGHEISDDTVAKMRAALIYAIGKEDSSKEPHTE